MKGEQLPLSVQLRETASFDNYHAGPNATAVAALRELADAASPARRVLIFGPEGAGKTHLLQALAREAGRRGLDAAYFPLATLADAGIEALQGFERADLMAFDDVDRVAGDPDWAQGLLRLIDRLQGRGAAWAISAQTAPEHSLGALPDLRTRLSAAAVMGLRPLDDAERLKLLAEAARHRGLELPSEAGEWMLRHLPRDVPSLLSALALLDRAALSAKRRLTLPFVLQTLAPALPAPGPESAPRA